ncbi:hypothetical protein [Tabrizicola sp. BL-A-41-H6]|uniref:hypothetical protein n=1 Tax=Tabrizicola sp. BL-A-41-H6 TaxID=3421107 RepID=UPI003D67D7E7
MELLLGQAVMLCLPAYLVAQVAALLVWPVRISAVPLAIMGAATASAVVGYASDSNLAPIFMVLAAPFCLLWLVLAGLIRGLMRGLMGR